MDGWRGVERTVGRGVGWMDDSASSVTVQVLST